MMNSEDISIVHWFPEKEKHKCGYCKNETGSVSYGMWAESLTVEDYQDLIDRGWRRSGKYCYKPMMDETCCPLYTIRCNASSFTLSKSQKKVIKKFNKFINDGLITKDQSETKPEPEESYSQVFYKEAPTYSTPVPAFSELVSEVPATKTAGNKNKIETCANVTPPNCGTVSVRTGENSVAKTIVSVRKGEGADPSKPVCKKAKLLRLERKQQKLLKRGMSLERINVQENVKQLEDFLEEVSDHAKHKLNIKLVSTSKPDSEWDRVKDLEYELYRKYQMKIHNDPPDKCSVRGFTRFLVNSPLKIKLERMHKKHKHFKTTARLFKKYQMAVHNDTEGECDEKQYLDFLVDTPLQPVAFESDAGVPGFGSYHQQYWIDDKLIAVGVIDILPRCVSSVYFFYDPDYRSLTLGTYGSLREVQFTKRLNRKIPSLEHYYMGFYIHSCPKMRYKGKLTPSFLLCPETYVWCALETCLAKLEASKYARLNDDVDGLDENLCSAEDVDMIKIVVGYRVTVFSVYKQRFGMQGVFENIGRLIGKKCIENMLFLISS